MTIQDYLALVTSEYTGQPNFNAMISFMVAVPVQVQSLLNEMMTTLFNISDNPVGNQLDTIGEWVGVSRNIAVPISGAGVFFSWDDTAADGWDSGTWATPGATQIDVLPDDAYLTLIKAKIAANAWDGTTTGAYNIYGQLFSNFEILIVDHQNMSFDLGIIGSNIDALTLALFEGGYIQLRPQGVMINDYFKNTDSNPLFAWDSNTALLAGWDTGSWITVLP
jgi:hypothetical protein